MMAWWTRMGLAEEWADLGPRKRVKEGPEGRLLQE